MMTLMMMRRIMKNRIAMIFHFGLKTEIIAESLRGVRQTQTYLIDWKQRFKVWAFVVAAVRRNSN